ncbi:mediator of RNA polymeras-like protein II transcription subunit 6 [Acephala macrosclerotiorum]|nr:mediator of RNA polymeras-like protein II transcription subunit 6 [Acephala macrosclerotiorum]
MALQETPLDEIQWRSPQAVAQMQGIHENSVLHYFALSPFFDPTSNNNIIATQAQFNPGLIAVVQTRAAFEAHLRTMSGLEYMISEQPAEMTPGAGTGVWVIRKQTRRKRHPQEDEITVHATYFVVGENIYMAPTVADVLGSRMLSIMSSLNNFMSSAGKLPSFSPALGHIYLPPSSANRKTNEPQLGQASKENTPLPESLQAPKKDHTQPNTSSYMSQKVLEEAIMTSLKYGDEYMDEIPITGQPGDFHLKSTGRKDASKLMVPAPGKILQMPGKVQPEPPSLKTDIPPERKGNRNEKSPKTPGMPKLKRRKSKALGAGNVSPT